MHNSSLIRLLSWKLFGRLANKLGVDKTDVIATLVLTSAALVGGAITIGLTIDIPGDGPTHAIQAYIWSRHPMIETNGIWLPGFSYMVGLCLMVLRDPSITPRLYNLGVSTMTIAPFYALIRKLYGPSEALLSTLALVALPLRVGIGASSLTEASFLCFVILGLLCLAIAVEHSGTDIVALLMSVFFLCLGRSDAL